jgi:hypothetical protein
MRLQQPQERAAAKATRTTASELRSLPPARGFPEGGCFVGIAMAPIQPVRITT